MSTSRKLEEIAANLDDMSITVEEIKEDLKERDSSGAPQGAKKLDQVQSDMERAADEIEAALTREPPDH
ncbi:MAG: hypothetical protein M3545_17495 [Acidobacteriota bacterium]|nr:hypothetical protein [Acidobacteriota bacterium]